VGESCSKEEPMGAIPRDRKFPGAWQSHFRKLLRLSEPVPSNVKWDSSYQWVVHTERQAWKGGSKGCRKFEFKAHHCGLAKRSCCLPPHLPHRMVSLVPQWNHNKEHSFHIFTPLSLIL
jgi:hypothetical protein